MPADPAASVLAWVPSEVRAYGRSLHFLHKAAKRHSAIYERSLQEFRQELESLVQGSNMCLRKSNVLVSFNGQHVTEVISLAHR